MTTGEGVQTTRGSTNNEGAPSAEEVQTLIPEETNQKSGSAETDSAESKSALEWFREMPKTVRWGSLGGIVGAVATATILGGGSPMAESDAPNPTESSIDLEDAPQGLPGSIEEAMPGMLPSENSDKNETIQEPEKESMITDDGNYKETVTHPDDTKITKEWYSPYAYTETITYPEEGSEPEETYQESSSEPLAGIEHPVYEQLTGVSYEEFLAEIKETIPEVSGSPYNAQDVLDGYNQRIMYAFKNRDPRAIELALTSNNPDYANTHEDIKNSIEEYNELDKSERAEWQSEWDEFDRDVELGVIINKEGGGDNSEVTTDYNITRTSSWTGNYTSVDNGQSPAKRQITFVRQHTPVGEIFLEKEDHQLNSDQSN